MSNAARLAEDKALRDAARALIDADLARLKGTVAARSVPARAMDRATEGAVEVLEQVADAAGRNKGVIAALVGATAIWLARHPLLALLDDRDPNPSDLQEQTHEQPPHQQ
ncbi:MAG: hypothetical protein ACK4GD_00465 [Sphingomonadaceae bacterium]